ncbi:DegT/DnrJ/EryC1/StrS family aminotransferase [bacterium]|nr:DegT/DnrJ/EryC1/StrS family aminotransferase [bacterium]
MEKTVLDQLVIFGGKPAFLQKLHVGRPNIGSREELLTRINELLDRKWLSNNGPFVQEFERRICELTNAKHCIAMCNATIALEIAIRAAGLRGEVIVPSFTFVATAHALQWQEITPVFCDIDPKNHNIDPNCIEEMITPKTTGIIGVHLWGRPCDITAMQAIADRHNLKLLFDAAHAFGCSYQGRMIGNFGDAEVFSFHATKFFNTFEGGAIVTNNDDLAHKARLMKNFGFAGYDNVIYIGTNGKMSEVSAAMGLTGLDSLDEFISINHRNYLAYQEGLSSIPGLRLIDFPENGKYNFQYMIVEVDEEVTGISRDTLVQILTSENVLARRYFFPGCHRMEPYRSYAPHAGLLLPETEKMSLRALSLPTGTAVGPEEIHQICRIIQLVIINSEKIGKQQLSHLQTLYPLTQKI